MSTPIGPVNEQYATVSGSGNLASHKLMPRSCASLIFLPVFYLLNTRPSTRQSF
jgi:hypothetical protein